MLEHCKWNIYSVSHLGISWIILTFVDISSAVDIVESYTCEAIVIVQIIAPALSFVISTITIVTMIFDPAVAMEIIFSLIVSLIPILLPFWGNWGSFSVLKCLYVTFLLFAKFFSHKSL